MANSPVVTNRTNAAGLAVDETVVVDEVMVDEVVVDGVDGMGDMNVVIGGIQTYGATRTQADAQPGDSETTWSPWLRHTETYQPLSCGDGGHQHTVTLKI